VGRGRHKRASSRRHITTWNDLFRRVSSDAPTTSPGQAPGRRIFGHRAAAARGSAGAAQRRPERRPPGLLPPSRRLSRSSMMMEANRDDTLPARGEPSATTMVRPRRAARPTHKTQAQQKCSRLDAPLPALFGSPRVARPAGRRDGPQSEYVTGAPKPIGGALTKVRTVRFLSDRSGRHTRARHSGAAGSSRSAAA
jgi:hypothetical protein